MPLSRSQAFKFAAPALLVLCAGAAAHGQTLNVIHDFRTTADGTFPSTRMTQAPDGSIYGATRFGGGAGGGTVFKITPNGVYKTIHNFEDEDPMGITPTGALAIGPDHAVYGTTKKAGLYGQGAIYRISARDEVTMVYSFKFASQGPRDPISGLYLNPYDHLLYGATDLGGANDAGTIFKVSTSGVVSVVASFSSATGNVSASPLVFNPADHMLYGTTYADGGHGQDSVYTISPTGVLQVVKTFTTPNGLTTNGGLTLAPDGALYGVAAAGGAYGKGTIYKIANGQFSTVYNFPGGQIGATPKTSMIVGKDGVLYGTVSAEGLSGFGGIFRVVLGEKPTVSRVYSFTNGHDGATPGALFQAADGLLYGACQNGGAQNWGSIFKASTGGSCVTILDLNEGYHDGVLPTGKLLLASDGYYYGTTQVGGLHGAGTIFRINAQGAQEIVYSFNQSSPSGYLPSAGLTQGVDGTMYGTTTIGGSSNAGCVFKCAFSGSPSKAEVSALYQFNNSYGKVPVAALIFGKDGYLYGAASKGSLADNGVIFRLSTTGAIKLLRGFSSASLGSQPTCTLVQGPDETLYGTTVAGGADGFGTVFALTTQGYFKWNRSLTAAQGKFPHEGLTFGEDGNLYGTAAAGGLYDKGSILKVTQAGVVSSIYSFAETTGNTPWAPLALGPDGTFYGATTTGGAYSSGSVFRIKNGVFSFLLDLDPLLGGDTQSGMTIGRDGNLYGVATQGGDENCGTVFVLDVDIPTVQIFSPTSATAGAKITIGGTNFTTANRVTINGSQVPFTRLSDTRITATVPVFGSMYGEVTVTASGGTAVGSGTFTLISTNGPPPGP
ncbi:MAG: choice-of-anchor tandem repeat GloVer-containing protein [Capsulimonas sp.]|uniref:choice-of-anchor tandem repeat GloVer-containing protein n=1 Tax=Capsulimonas sp. TaxID=2494211 RepID=UPI003267B6FC